MNFSLTSAFDGLTSSIPNEWLEGEDPFLACGLLYCPRPEISKELSLEWIRSGGFRGKLLISHDYALGIIGNYIQTCRLLLEKTGQPWLVIFENDVQPCFYAREILVDFLKTLAPDNVGCVSLFTPTVYGKCFAEEKGWTEIEVGWGNLTGQAICYPRKRLQRILDDFHWSPLALNSLRLHGSGGGIDSVVGDMMLRQHLPIYFHSPSLSEHQGLISSRVGGGKGVNCYRGLKFSVEGITH